MSLGSERAVLSDVLPYELPVAFNNGSFAHLLARLNLRQEGNAITARWLGGSTSAVLSLLFGSRISVSRPTAGVDVQFIDPLLGRDRLYPRTRALSYNIGKTGSGVRTVALMHPRSQIAVADFYAKYKDALLYYTTRSKFSIRHPADVARFSVTRDAVFAEELDTEPVGVEEIGREYEQLRSYFTYGGYSHIYKFHESPEMRRLERKYGLLVQVDVTRCFDSVYTHTISWVTNGLEDSKTRTPATLGSFGGQFDKLMQAANDLETHGILIGPEVSRVFAEIILQEVDVRVERALRMSGSPLRHRHDYEIRRFVDDYFLFCSSEEAARRLVSVLGSELKNFRLYLNDAKRRDERTPLRSHRSVAKYQVKASVQRMITAVERESEQGEPCLPQLSAPSENLLLEYKGILLSTGLEHEDLANYALVQLEFEFESVLRQWRAAVERLDVTPTQREWVNVARFISGVLDVAVSLFAGGVSASHSVKLARIAHTSLQFVSVSRMPTAVAAVIESKIAAEISTQIRRPPSEVEAPMHALILLDALSSMDEDGMIDADALRYLLNMDGVAPNAIALLTVLRYCGTRPDLASLRAELESLAFDRAASLFDGSTPEADSLLIASALLASPFQSTRQKSRLFERLGLNVGHHPAASAAWPTFFQWEIPDYYEALQKKRGGDVY